MTIYYGLQSRPREVYNYSMLYEQLQAEQITALKSKDTLKLQTIRGIIALVKNKEIEKKLL